MGIQCKFLDTFFGEVEVADYYQAIGDSNSGGCYQVKCMYLIFIVQMRSFKLNIQGSDPSTNLKY